MSIRLSAAERRPLILQAALREFSAAGFHATSMNDIAAAGGITKPVLYQHFASKRALYLALIDEVAASMLEAIGKATANAPDARAQTERGVIAYFEWMAVNRRLCFALWQRCPARRRVFNGRAQCRATRYRSNRAAHRRGS